MGHSLRRPSPYTTTPQPSLTTTHVLNSPTAHPLHHLITFPSTPKFQPKPHTTPWPPPPDNPRAGPSQPNPAST